MARIPKLDSAGRFLAADVNAQIDARTKATMRADLPALAKELKIGGVDGSVPIFATLAEAQAWEAANPGKKALTLEPSTPDTTAPTPGVLSVSKTHNSAALSVSGATDDRAVTEYAFQVGATGMWSVWQTAPSYEASGLTPSTSYAFRHKVRDRAGNEAVGVQVTVTTDAKPPVQAGDVITSDAFTFFADGTPINGKATDCTLGGDPMTWIAPADAPTTSGGSLLFSKSAEARFAVSRLDRELGLTIKALPTGGTNRLMVRSTGAAHIIVSPATNGAISTVLQGPDGNITGPSAPAGTLKVGSRVEIGAKGNAGYVNVDGVKVLDLPDLRGNTGAYIAILGDGGLAVDDVVVKAL